MTDVDFAAAAFLAGAFFEALGADFFTSATFLVGAASALAGLFLLGFEAAAGVGLAVFLDALPPKILSQPSEYFSFVPTRVIVTESPSTKTETVNQKTDRLDQTRIALASNLHLTKLAELALSGQYVFNNQCAIEMDLMRVSSISISRSNFWHKDSSIIDSRTSS